MSIDSKVIGYFAYLSPLEVLCDGDACVISGSEERMRSYIKSIGAGPLERHTIRKTRFGDIITGMEMGGAYAFDEESYNRFYPLANKIGFNLKEEEFSAPAEGEYHFVMIKQHL